jgi:inorganic pyrophosphatase
MHPWHDLDPGASAPEVVQCLIEIPQGGHVKYELDKATGLLRLDRVLYSAVHYPANYGIVPRTYWPDGDPLDILVLAQEPFVPMCIVRARPIGVMQMLDGDDEDDKLIAVHVDDPSVSHLRDLEELPPHKLNELEHFFSEYKVLEHSPVTVGQFRGATRAREIVSAGMRLYAENRDQLVAGAKLSR